MKVLNVKKHPYNSSTGLYIGRENKTYNFPCSKWHNPFVITTDTEWERENVLIAYENHIRNTPELWNALEELDGLDLFCWCFPKKCHGEILIKLLNEKKYDGYF